MIKHNLSHSLAKIGTFRGRTFYFKVPFSALKDTYKKYKKSLEREKEGLNALCPMVVRRSEWTDRCMEEEDLRGRDGVGIRTRSDRLGGEVVDGLEC